MVGKHHNMEEEKKNFKRCENNFLKKQIKEKTRKKVLFISKAMYQNIFYDHAAVLLMFLFIAFQLICKSPANSSVHNLNCIIKGDKKNYLIHLFCW